MTTGSIGPGTVLAGRYRLDDLLTESDGARFWRATDTILARSVAIHAVPSDDPRAAGLLDAARVSATITDPHLLRVLDCDDDDGITWVVNEWGDGVSLDLMLHQGTLPPDRAAWLAREVAEAIAAGHAQGVAHGRLNPEAVLVTHAGAVKLIGYVVDATLEAPRPPDPLYGELDEREADVINLAGILYAALTGTWPGVARSSVPRAPREAKRPLRPRQVKAGVPRTLDAICDRVLHKEASRHSLPIETAYEIAAALSDYVGDPGLSAPIDPAALLTEPEPAPHREDPAGGAETQVVPGLAAAEEALAQDDRARHDPAQDRPDTPEPDPEATQLSPAVPPQVDQPRDQPGDQPVQEPVAAEADPGEDTQLFQQPAHGPDSLHPLRGRSEGAAPPPPFEEPPERPLFATTERRVPAGAVATGLTGATGASGSWLTRTGAHDGADAGQGPGNGSGNGSLLTDTGTGSHPPAAATGGGAGAGTGSFWPFVDEEEQKSEVHTGKEGRGWLRTAVAVGVLLLLLVAMVVAFNRGRQDAGSPSSGPSPSSDASPAAQRQTITVAAAKDFDPEGNPAEENPKDVAKAIDRDPATGWSTMTYYGNPQLGGLKSGVGLLLDLGKDQPVSSLTVRFAGGPTSFTAYAAAQGVTAWPESLDQLDKIGSRADVGARATVRVSPATTTRYLLVWLTKLPAGGGGYRGQITDVTVTS